MEYTNIFESAAAQPGARATETAHRKVELQSPADLTFLVANVSRAARDKIDRHLPPDAAGAHEGEGGMTGAAAGGDVMQERVEGLVDDYIRATFRAAKDGMSINGMDAAELDAELAKAQEGEEIEPFDTKLAHRIQALAAQIEAHTLALANLRRSAPAATAARFRDAFARAAERDDERLRVAGAEGLRQAEETWLDVGEIDRLDEVRRTWEAGSSGLAEFNAGLASTVARMEKARTAVGVLQES